MNLRFAAFSFAVLARHVADAQDDRLCGTLSVRQADYRGDIAVTANGRTCQAWTSQTPHSHGNTPQAREGKGLDGGHNYCRNPDGEPKAWCYTTDPAKRWELCAVPACSTVTYPTIPGGDTSSGAAAAVTTEMIEAEYTRSTGVCFNAENGDSVDRVQMDGLYATDAEGPGTCYNFCEPIKDEPGYVGMQWTAVNLAARCICLFDDGTMPEVLPGGVTTFTDRLSVGAIAGNGNTIASCYAFKGYMDATRRSIYGTGTPLTDYLDMDVYGAAVQIANAEVQYDQNQNPTYADRAAPTFSADHSTLSATGNTWSAYLLPEEITVHEDTVLQFNFTLDEETVLGFQAVCLDADTEETGSNGRCFVLRSSQGWVQHMVNVPTQTMVGETTVHSIPVGDFFTGPVNYVAFLQDSDGQDRSTGGSSVSGLKLVSMVNEYLEIEIDGTMEYLQNEQQSFMAANSAQDTGDYWMHLSEDHKAVQINGNQWKALPLNAPYDITANTILEFDIVVGQSVDFHAICLDADLTMADNKNCVVVQNPNEAANNFHHITTKLVTGEPKRIVIPFGSYMNLKEGEVDTVNYLAFIQDNDQSELHKGRSTWSNFRVYEDASRFPIALSLFGANVTVPNIQEALSNDAGDMQDSRDHIMSVSSDGLTITATSNSWKMLELPSSFAVTPATVLKFDFQVEQEAELHAICLLNQIRIKDGRNDCFFTAGLQSHSSTQGQMIEPYTHEGEMNNYEIVVGSYFTGEVQYLGILVDNDLGFTGGDVERTYGQSSWSNIAVYNLPSLDIGFDGGFISIDNHQLSYDQNQDSTPIRNYMATIDHDSINFSGNVWRALELPTPLSPTDLGDFVVSFDFAVVEAAEIHAICFEENREFGDQDQPANVDPRRCVATSYFQDAPNVLNVMYSDYQTRPGESHRYVLNLSKMYDRMYGPIKYIAFVHDNDLGDKRAGDSTYSNIAITTTLTSCLDDANFAFDLDDCTVGNFLGKVQEAMEAKATCTSADPLIELMAIFDATQEMDVYKKIEKICTEAYKLDQYDFADNNLGIDEATERQLVKEYIDGGTVLNYETEAESAVNVGFVNSEHATSRLLSWPKHHALDNCDIGAAMCCFIASRTNPAPVTDNSDVCYVNMKASKRTAHVAAGWSIYGEGDSSEDMYCEGFAWGNDGGSLSSALKGNALFHVGFMENFSTGSVEQVPGAPLCGCMDKMPVVTNAACTDVSAPGSVLNVSFDSAVGLFRSTFTLGNIEYGTCGDSAGLVDHYATLVGEGKATSVDVAYMQGRLVGDGGCDAAINKFLAGKGLVKA